MTEPSDTLRREFGDIDIYLFDQLHRGNITIGMRVLDAGFGHGRNLVYLLRQGFDVSGVDNGRRSDRRCPSPRQGVAVAAGATSRSASRLNPALKTKALGASRGLFLSNHDRFRETGTSFGDKLSLRAPRSRSTPIRLSP
jgi:hypothetical protein